MTEIIIFAIIQLINVSVSTIKYVLTYKASPFWAGVINALSYTISAVATKYITGMELEVIIPITFVCNLIGVPLGRWYLEKTEKEKLWVFNSTIKATEDDIIGLRYKLKEQGIHSTYETISENQLYAMKFFCYLKTDSDRVKQVLKSYRAKYYVVEAR